MRVDGKLIPKSTASEIVSVYLASQAVLLKNSTLQDRRVSTDTEPRDATLTVGMRCSDVYEYETGLAPGL